MRTTKSSKSPPVSEKLRSRIVIKHHTHFKERTATFNTQHTHLVSMETKKGRQVMGEHLKRPKQGMNFDTNL